jgi:PPOX class probable F420-dependent enzyme
MPKMSKEDIAAFVQKPLHGILATVRREGAPQLTPVWYIVDDGRILISMIKDSAKHRNILRDPRVSLCIDGGRDDVRAVVFYGTASVVTEEPLQEQMRWRVIRHYYESEQAAREYYESIRDQPSVLLVMQPDRVVSQDFRD